MRPPHLQRGDMLCNSPRFLELWDTRSLSGPLKSSQGSAQSCLKWYLVEREPGRGGVPRLLWQGLKRAPARRSVALFERADWDAEPRPPSPDLEHRVTGGDEQESAALLIPANQPQTQPRFGLFRRSQMRCKCAAVWMLKRSLADNGCVLKAGCCSSKWRRCARLYLLLFKLAAGVFFRLEVEKAVEFPTGSLLQFCSGWWNKLQSCTRVA